jgi:hypothetical protein
MPLCYARPILSASTILSDFPLALTPPALRMRLRASALFVPIHDSMFLPVRAPPQWLVARPRVSAPDTRAYLIIRSSTRW